MNVVALLVSLIAADHYSPDARAIYISSALEAIEDADKKTLADASNYISAMDRNRCRSAFRRLRAQCLIDAAARNCKSLPADKREPCAIYLDIVVTNTLAEQQMLSEAERHAIMEKNRDYKSALRLELQRRYGSLAAGFRLSKYYSCGAGSANRACLAAAIDGYCRDQADQQTLAWQHCAAALVWFIATSRES
jgi:hypothetical protein